MFLLDQWEFFLVFNQSKYDHKIQNSLKKKKQKKPSLFYVFCQGVLLRSNRKTQMIFSHLGETFILMLRTIYFGSYLYITRSFASNFL